jgi:hypothetical protein
MNTPDFVCGISPGSIAAAGRDTAVTARPVATTATQVRAFAIELILLCRRRPEGITSCAEEDFCHEHRQFILPICVILSAE